MAKIPTGNFGFDAPQPSAPADTTPIARGLQAVAGGLEDIHQRLAEDKLKQARSDAAQAYLDHELATKTAAQDVADQLQTGQLKPEDARAAYEKVTNAIPKAEVALPLPEKQNLDRQLQRLTAASAIDVTRAADATQRAIGKANFAAGLDKLAKLGSFPGANIDEINSRAGAFAETGVAAGIPKDLVDKTVQDFKDKNWLNHATQRAMESADNLDALNSLQHDLTAADGYYVGKLDTDKRNAVLRSVLNDKAQIEARLEHHADRREARAQVAMNEIDRQIASGVPATAAMWANWSTEIDGTSQSDAFKQSVKDEQQMQDVLRQPIDAQVKFAQDAEQKLMAGGGNLRQAANLTRMKDTVTHNVQLLQQAPLVFNANRTGEQVQPIDPSALADPNSPQLASQLRDRAITLDAMRSEYGDAVPMRLLLPQEAQTLGALLQGASAAESGQLFGRLRNAAGSDAAYQSLMQQIAPDAPVKALAGQLAARQNPLVLEHNWIRDDVYTNSTDVANTMLAGESILHPPKATAGQDGTPKLSLYLPSGASTALQDRFQNVVGSVFAQRPAAAELAFQAVQAYYVGKAAQSGRLAADAKDIDERTVREAVRAVLGNVVDYNGRGEVLAPWGMEALAFEDAAQGALRTALPEATREQLSQVGLLNRTETTYYVTRGRTPMQDGKGNPLVIDVAPGRSAGGF
jgi:hypothetical protein